MGEVKECESCGRDIYEGTKCEDCKKNKRSIIRSSALLIPFVAAGVKEAYKKFIKHS